MANIPSSVGIPTVTPTDEAPAQIRLNVSPSAFGGAVAKGTEQLGQGASAVGAYYNEATADNAANGYQSDVNKILHGDPTKMVTLPDGTQGPDTGYLGLKGRAAMDARPGVEKQMEDLRQKYKGTLLAPVSSTQFDNFSRRYHAYAIGQVGTHVDTQSNAWYQEVNVNTAKTQMDTISASPDNDEVFKHANEDLRAAYVKIAQIKTGSNDPAIVNKAISDADRDAWKSRILAIGAKPDGAGAAAALTEQHQKELGPEYHVLADHYRTRAETEGAVGGGIQLFHELNAAPPQGLAPPMQGVKADAQSALDAKGIPLKVTSEARTAEHNQAVGGAPGSTHLHGNAMDVALTGYTDAQKQTVLDHFLGDPRVTGVGWEGDHLHVDVGHGQKTAWGADDTPASLANAPGWVQQKIGAWKGAQTAQRDSTGKQALDAPPDLKDVESPTEKLARITQQGVDRIDQMNLPPRQKEQMLNAFKAQVSTHELAINLQEKVKKDNNEKAMDDYVKGMAPGQPVSPNIVQQITNDPRLTPQTREHLIAAAKVHSGNDVEQATQAYGPGFWDAYKKVVAPAGDPTRIADPTALLSRAGPGGDLTLAGVAELQKTMGASQRSVSDHAVAQTQASLMQYAKNKLSFEQDLGPIKLRDPKGEALFNGQFVPKFLSAYDDWTKAGKQPWEFLKQENVDKMIQGMRSPSEMARDRLAATGETSPNAEAPGTPLPPAPEGVKPETWNNIMQQVPVLPGGQVASHQQWAQAIQLLKDNPTPQMMGAFDRWGVKAGYQAKDILQQMGVTSPEGAIPAPTAAATPTPAAPTSAAVTPSAAPPAVTPAPGETPEHRDEREKRRASIQEGLLAISEGREPRFGAPEVNPADTEAERAARIERVRAHMERTQAVGIERAKELSSSGPEKMRQEVIARHAAAEEKHDREYIQTQMADLDKREKEIEKLPENDVRRTSQLEMIAKQRDWLKEQMPKKAGE